MNISTHRKREFIRGKTFLKNVTRSKHLFRMANAYAVDTAQIKQFEDTEVNLILFSEEDTGTVYATTPEAFRLHGFEKQFPGYEKQTFLPLKHWQELANGISASEPEPQEEREGEHNELPITNSKQLELLERRTKSRQEGRKLAKACKLLLIAWRKGDERRYEQLLAFIANSGEE